MTEIRKSGVQERFQLPVEDNPPLAELKFSQVTRLADLAAEYKFFTHALLFTHGRWPRDPINDYLIEENPEHAPLVMDLPSNFLLGMWAKDEHGHHRYDWGKKLLAIRHEGWEQLFAFMSTVGSINRDKRHFTRLLAQLLPTFDVLGMKSTHFEEPCRIDVVAFGLDSNVRSVYFEVPQPQTGIPSHDMPRVKVGPPDPETVDLAQRLFRGEPHPYWNIDQKQTEAKLALVADQVKRTSQNIVQATSKLIV